MRELRIVQHCKCYNITRRYPNSNSNAYAGSDSNSNAYAGSNTNPITISDSNGYRLSDTRYANKSCRNSTLIQPDQAYVD